MQRFAGTRLGVALLTALLVGQTTFVLAQGAPWRLVHAGDGTLWVIADGARHQITPDPIGDDELAAIPMMDPWLGTIGPSPAAAGGQPPSAVGSNRGPGQIQAIDTRVYKDVKFGNSSALGVIKNTGDSTAFILGVDVSLIDEAGGVARRGSTRFRPNVLEPGASAPWSATIDGWPELREIRVQVQTGDPDSPAARSITHDLRADGVTVSAPATSSDGPTISGQVVNIGSDPIKAPWILATFRDADGRLQDVHQAYAGIEVLLPGQSAPFRISTLRDRVGESIGSFELFLEARRV
jgi:hypothetical protein